MNQYVLPIAPSPIAVAGHKRKLTLNSSSNNAIHTTAALSSSSYSPTSIPRRESAPGTVAPVVDSSVAITKPSDYWKSLLEKWKVPILDTVGIEQDDSSRNPKNNVVFLETTPDRVEAYQNFELQAAVRRRDMVTLKKIAAEKHASGNGTMNACNRFGESILHLACRKGSLDVVQLLVSTEIDGCGCSLLVRDDYGRTVLHDACWTVSPPWELIKLILKKAPVLWRVSDVRGHLALQYVPKSAWPQWVAFLSKNKDLLQRIMVHSYHQIDILQQQPHHQAQQPQARVKQEIKTTVPQNSSTNDASAVTPQKLPQHQQHATATPQQHLPTTVSLPVSTHNSAEQLSVAITAAVASKPGSFSLSASSGQARNILARALAQANPAMVQAISQGHQQPLQQGLSRFAPSKATAKAEATTTQQLQQQEQQSQAAAAPLAPAPGPATAALDEALRAMSATRSKVRSSFLLTEQQREAEDHHDCDSPQKANANHRAPRQQAATPNDDGSQLPLPYAPSISMIAARLGRYQTSKKNNAAVAAASTTPPSATVTSQGVEARPPQESPEDSSLLSRPRNPLPAVPNPLMTASEKSPDQRSGRSQGQQGVPSSITTRTKNSPSESMVPNPMVVTVSQEQDTPCHGGGCSNNGSYSNINSVSSVTGSTSTMNATTDTDSDRVTSSSSNPSPESSFFNEVTSEAPTTDRSGVEENNNKLSLDASKKRMIG
jgi:hypothetical protein